MSDAGWVHFATTAPVHRAQTCDAGRAGARPYPTSFADHAGRWPRCAPPWAKVFYASGVAQLPAKQVLRR
jgi:hypothetical protein